MSITTAGDNLIHYEALGRGKPLIFVHGWLGSWRYWWPSMQALSSHHRTFALDLWGFGDSSKATEQYSLSHYVDLLNAFVDRLGIVEPVVLVGHGLGAAVALRYAATNPEAVERLAVVALPVSGEELNSRILQDNGQTSVSRVTAMASSFPELEVETRKTDPAARMALTSEVKGANFTSELTALTCPLLMIFGEQDPLVQQPGDADHILRQPLANRAYVSFPSCMHFPMLEETAKFNRLILEFIRASDDISALMPKDYWKRRTY